MLTVEELNQALIDTIEYLKSQPTGTKSKLFGKNSKLIGVEASEKAAELHAKNINDYDLKAKFEKLGVKYQIAPALIAGKASRESNMGQTLQRGNRFTGVGAISRSGKAKPNRHITGSGFYSSTGKLRPLPQSATSLIARSEKSNSIRMKNAGLKGA